MLIPSKHEALNKNILVIGGKILSIIKKRACNIEELFQELKNISPLNLDQYYNTITFLWLADAIETDNFSISIKKPDVSQ